MEKRDGGVNEKRVSREEDSYDPVSRLVEERTGDDEEKVYAIVEKYAIANRA